MNGQGGSSSTVEFAYAGIAGAVGGLLGFAGVYEKWFSYSYATGGLRVTLYMNGSEDWTGQVAFIAGIAAFAFGAAYVLLSDAQIRKLTAAFMGIGAVFLLAMALLAFSRVREVVGSAPFTPGVTAGETVTITQAVAGGLWMSIVGGVLAVYGAYLAVRRG
ncbi:MAG: hypothetical protein HY240_10950 [Actinobacteria bacterium]|nr:hypothetical protein [Actinomycetota bacterium]